MKPLWVLLVAFAVSLLGVRVFSGEWVYSLAGNVAMAVMLLFTAIGHFAFKKGMAMMLPNFIPLRVQVVLMTGLIEIAAAVGLLIPSLRETTAVLLITFFILILPANIYAALKGVDYQKGTYDGPNVSYLWVRVPLQVFFIGWVIFFSLYYH
jgi:uncharacterized membrane protein